MLLLSRELLEGSSYPLPRLLLDIPERIFGIRIDEMELACAGVVHIFRSIESLGGLTPVAGAEEGSLEVVHYATGDLPVVGQLIQDIEECCSEIGRVVVKCSPADLVPSRSSRRRNAQAADQGPGWFVL